MPTTAGGEPDKSSFTCSVSNTWVITHHPGMYVNRKNPGEHWDSIPHTATDDVGIQSLPITPDTPNYHLLATFAFPSPFRSLEITFLFWCTFFCVWLTSLSTKSSKFNPLDELMWRCFKNSKNGIKRYLFWMRKFSIYAYFLYTKFAKKKK